MSTLERRTICAVSSSSSNTRGQLRDLQGTELPGYRRSLQSCVDVGPIRGLEAAYDAVSKVAAGPAQEPLQVLVIHVSPAVWRG